jgi:hypothetical protein
MEQRRLSVALPLVHLSNWVSTAVITAAMLGKYWSWMQSFRVSFHTRSRVLGSKWTKCGAPHFVHLLLRPLAQPENLRCHWLSALRMRPAQSLFRDRRVSLFQPKSKKMGRVGFTRIADLFVSFVRFRI